MAGVGGFVFGSISADGTRSRGHPNGFPDTDVVVDVGVGLPNQPQTRDEYSGEISIRTVPAEVNRAISMSTVTRGTCEGFVPSLSPSGVRDYWIRPVDLQYVEYDCPPGMAVPQASSAIVNGGLSKRAIRVLRGTIVGFADASNVKANPPSGNVLAAPITGRVILWQPRGVDTCCVLDLTRARLIQASRCRHCGIVIPADESACHMQSAHPEIVQSRQRSNPFREEPPASLNRPMGSNLFGVPTPQITTTTPITTNGHRYSGNSNVNASSPERLTQTPNAPGAATPFGATTGSTYSSPSGTNMFGMGGVNMTLTRNATEDNMTYMMAADGATWRRMPSTSCGETASFRTLKRLSKLGEGAQGQVYLCERPSDGRRLVVKDLLFKAVADAQTFYQQTTRYTQLSHVHLIRYLAVEVGTTAKCGVLQSQTEAYVSILMPYYDEGDVASLIANADPRKPGTGAADWHSIASLVLQIATALHYLHSLSPPVAHGDIKPGNVLLYNRREQVVLMDLDTAKEFGTHTHFGAPASTVARAGECSMEWAAPETVHRQEVRPQSDIWSLGLLAFAMIAIPEYLMFRNPATNEETLLNSNEWHQDRLDDTLRAAMTRRQCPHPLQRQVLKMVRIAPHERPSARDLAHDIEECMIAMLEGRSF